MNLPDWFDIQSKIDNGEKPTALEHFVYCNEPGAGDDEKRFREELAAALSEVSGAQYDPNLSD